MRAVAAASGCVLIGGCLSTGASRIEIASAVNAGETVVVVEMTSGGTGTFSIAITHRGPLMKSSTEDCAIEILNGDDVLGRLGPGESRTFSWTGKRCQLKVRALGGAARFEGLLLSGQ